MPVDPPVPTYPALPHHVAAHARVFPDRVALIDGDAHLTYAELARRMQQGVACMQARGVTPGSRVLVLARSKLDLMLATLAAMGAGAAVLPVAANEENPADARAYFRPDLIVLDRERHRAGVFPDDDCVSVADFDTATPAELVAIDPESIGLLILTSGTTRGVRRGALLSHRALCGTAAYMNARMGIDDAVRDLVTAPLEHGFGMGRARCALHAGGTAVFQSGLFSAAAAAEALLNQQCNMLSAAVSAMTLMIDDATAAMQAAAPGLRWIELGTGHLPHRHREWVLQTFSTTRCFVSYGLTEAIRCTFLELNAERAKIDSVGTPSPGIRVRLVSEAGQRVAPGEPGWIEVNGVNKASGYLDQPDAWAEKQDGEWLVSGDIGQFDTDGYLYYVGRTDDMINVGGLKVAPQEVEEALAAELAGTAYAVARIPDPEGVEGYVPALFLEGLDARPDWTPERMRESLRDRLPNFKIPRRVYRVETLPRTPGTRKIRRAALADVAHKIDQAQLPTWAALLARLKVQRPAWPAFAGEFDVTRKMLARRLRAGATRIAALDALAGAASEAQPDAAWLDWRTLLPLHPGDALALARGVLPDAAEAALVAHALASDATLVWLAARAPGSLAADLGIVHRHAARHVLVDGVRLARWATASPPLEDSLRYPGFETLQVVGERPDTAVLAAIHERLGARVEHLRCQRGHWQRQRLPCDNPLAGDAAGVWARLQQVAAAAFHTDPARLTPRATPDTTPGWDSLGFVALVAGVEVELGVHLSPREIAGIRALADVLAVLTQRASTA